MTSSYSSTKKVQVAITFMYMLLRKNSNMNFACKLGSYPMSCMCVHAHRHACTFGFSYKVKAAHVSQSFPKGV